MVYCSGSSLTNLEAEAAALTQVELLKTENAALKDQIEFLREALQLELAQRTTPLCRNVDHPQVYIVDALGHSWSLFLDLITSKEVRFCLFGARVPTPTVYDTETSTIPPI